MDRRAGKLISDPGHPQARSAPAGRTIGSGPRDPPTVVATVENLDSAGRGIVRIDGRSVAVDGAMVGERVLCRPGRGRRRGQRAELVKVLEPAQERIAPVCPHFGVCGGCRLQHMPGDAQLAWKQQGLHRAFIEHGGVEPELFMDPLVGPSTGYRRRARLGVKHVPGKGGALVGFREKSGAKLAELESCAILDPRIGGEIENIRRMIDKLDIRQRVPQLEVAMGDTGTALVLRHLEPLSPGDRRVLVDFVRERDWQLHVQAAGPDSVQPLWPANPPPLTYCLPDFDLVLEFLPMDFIQVNAAMNHLLVRTAVEHLDVRPDSRVLDLYCGIGNFSLALARKVAHVTGVEGDETLVARAMANARRNRIDNAAFASADLSLVDRQRGWWNEEWDRMLLDPPRSGAGELLGALDGWLPRRIVYVSCNPETLARDAGVLVNRKGYRMRRAGVVDMFPHTAHCEAIAVFDLRAGA